MYIFTIGDLANYDVTLLKQKFKSYGEMIWKYANGFGDDEVNPYEEEAKIISNSLTLPRDVQNKPEAHKVLMEITEKLCRRLRDMNKYCTTVSVQIRTSEFVNYSHQKRFKTATNSTKVIYDIAVDLFDNKWQYEPIRLLGISLSNLCDEVIEQTSFFQSADNNIKNQKIDKVMDKIQDKYGKDIINRLSNLDNKSSDS